MIFKEFSLVLFLLIHFLIPNIISAQSKMQKWGKAEISYTKSSSYEKRDYSITGESAGEVISKSFISAYWFFISDVDGDNCPFYPSCSSFFVEAVNETNIFKGTLMFADRFTRDINIFNREKYPVHKTGKLYDPPSLYTLKQNE